MNYLTAGSAARDNILRSIIYKAIKPLKDGKIRVKLHKISNCFYQVEFILDSKSKLRNAIRWESDDILMVNGLFVNINAKILISDPDCVSTITTELRNGLIEYKKRIKFPGSII